MTISVSVNARYEQIYLKVPIVNIKIHAEHIYSTVQCVQYSTVRTIQYSTPQYSTVQYSTVQYSTVQYSTAQCNTAQCSTIQYVQYSTYPYV